MYLYLIGIFQSIKYKTVSIVHIYILFKHRPKANFYTIYNKGKTWSEHLLAKNMSNLGCVFSIYSQFIDVVFCFCFLLKRISSIKC